MEVFLAKQKNFQKLYKIASWLIAFTIIYNLIEGFVSIYFGFEEESLTLFGFGVDSFIEVMSGIGVADMIYRIKRSPASNRDNFENTALKITGTAFYILVAGLTITSIYNISVDHNPLTTFWGVVISLFSIIVMWALIMAKTKVGSELNSQAILADAQCTKVCVYMSIILLASSGVYEIFRIPYIDSIGTLGLAYYSYKEAKECFEKANTNKVCCDHC